MEGKHRFQRDQCPFTGERLALVPALKPDVAIVQAQEQMRGEYPFLGREAVWQRKPLYRKKVVVVVEELVSKKAIQRDAETALLSPDSWSMPSSRSRGGHTLPHAGVL